MAGTYDMKVDQGAHFSETITWKDSGDNPIDNSSYSAKLQIKEFADEPGDSAIVSLTDGSGIALGGSNGQFTITMSASQTASLPSGECVYDLLITDGGGVVSRLLEGKVIVSPRVTVP